MESRHDPVDGASSNDLPDSNGHGLHAVQPKPNTRIVLPPMGWKFGLIAAGAVVIGMVLATTLFVLIRDSMIVSGSLDVGTAVDATMVCVDGTVSYAGFNPMDRILGNGVFACREWKATKRYTVLPK